MSEWQNSFQRLECRCPVCGTVQEWQDECERCHADIRILRRLADETYLLQRRCFEALTTGEHFRAEQAAEQLAQIFPTPLYEMLSRFVRR
ncbi:MAG: hypothetical protein LBT05_04215 [Planctomycetaceae bacterium]|jgi:hypothetical protein|nr:hypothetical protein [Planctomycetaceae bacterium]